MLVNIYGSKELFVNEYRTLLSNRLLNQWSYDTDREIRNLELLKLRFGEAPLHQCEVMLKDIGDSKRINNLLHSEEDGTTHIKFTDWPVNSIIVSAQFWPQFKSETLELPKEITQGLQSYTKAFEGRLQISICYFTSPNDNFAPILLELTALDYKFRLSDRPNHWSF